MAMKSNNRVAPYGLILGLLMTVALLVPPDHAYSEESGPDELFKSLGIIKLAGILAPKSRGLTDMKGNPVALSDFQGKIVFINFWTTWCPDCVYEMPDIEKLQQRINHPDFTILAVNLKESPKKIKLFLARHKLTYQVLLDQKGNMGRTFGIRSIPTTFILNRKGGMIGKAMGPRDWGGEKSAALFEYLLKTDEPVSALRGTQ